MVEELLHQQQAAARRVQQMQDHSRRVFEEYQHRPPRPSAGTAQPMPQLYNRRLPDPCPPPCPPPAEVQKPGSFLAALDTDQWMLLGLILLLLRAGCRTELLIALLYLAL